MYWQQATATMLKTLVTAVRPGLITDLDGTLSPIVDEPDAAQITPRNRQLLAALQEHLALVAVISGRAVTDLRARVDLPGLTYLGNHGLEGWSDGQVVVAPEVAAWRPALTAAADSLQSHLKPGMMLEDKGVTLSIHYRRTHDPRAAAAAFAPEVQAVAAQHALNVFHGRMVFELRPPIAVHKGTALRSLVDQHALDAVVYLGDDTTDVDAMRMARSLREQQASYCLALGVISAGAPAAVRDEADLFLSSVADVEAFLAWLLKARSASAS